MPVTSTTTSFRTLDGLHLAATLVTPTDPPERAVVLVHGGGVTREEGGFFMRLAAGLGEAGVRRECPAHERCPVRIGDDDADFPALDALASRQVADGRLVGGTAELGLLPGALLGLGGQVSE